MSLFEAIKGMYEIWKIKECMKFYIFYLIGKRVPKILWQSFWNLLDCVHFISYIVAAINVAEVDQKVVACSG